MYKRKIKKNIASLDQIIGPGSTVILNYHTPQSCGTKEIHVGLCSHSESEFNQVLNYDWGNVHPLDKFSSLVFGNIFLSSFKKGKKTKQKPKGVQRKKGRGCLGLPLVHLYWLVSSLSWIELDKSKIGQLGKRLTSRNLAFSYTLSFSSTSSSQLNWNLFTSELTIWKRQEKRSQFLVLSW